MASTTGFVAYHRGWNELRAEDLGFLWEHFVLNELMAQLQTRRVQYWRDKAGHEVDFVLGKRRQEVAAIECKWSAEGFDPGNLRSFRGRYPKGPSYVVSQDVKRPYVREWSGVKVEFVGLRDLVARITG